MQLEDYWILARYNKIRFHLLLLDLLDWMAETTKNRFHIDDIFSIFLTLFPLHPQSIFYPFNPGELSRYS